MAEIVKRSCELPAKYEGHSMAQKYEYINYDKETGIISPSHDGSFIVKRPHYTFLSPAKFNFDVDPFPMLEEARMERGDVLLITAAKTGRHLVGEILRMLLAGKAAHADVSMYYKWLDVSPYNTITENQPAPRMLSSHLPLSGLPPTLRGEDTKVVVTMRNLKDVCVSYYNHIVGMDLRPEKPTWSEFFNYFLHSKTANFSTHFDFYADVWDKHRTDPNVLIVTYETLIREKRDTLEEIAKHIGVQYTDALIDDVAAATEFQTMKKAKHDHEKFFRNKFGEEFSFYRKGQVGDWKNWFTVAQNEEFDEVFNQWNKERQIPMIYE